MKFNKNDIIVHKRYDCVRYEILGSDELTGTYHIINLQPPKYLRASHSEEEIPSKILDDNYNKLSERNSGHPLTKMFK